jgi:hypothetical protein
MEIIYKTIPIAPDYKISESGVIISEKYKTFRTLKQTIEESGYRAVALCVNGKYVRKRVHQWVAITYLDNPLGYNEVNHIDADKTNNHYSNLEWCTHTHNIRHSFSMGLVTRKSGSESHMFDKGRKVIVNGLTFNSVAEAARQIGRPRPSLSGELRGDRENKSGIRYAD